MFLTCDTCKSRVYADPWEKERPCPYCYDENTCTKCHEPVVRTDDGTWMLVGRDSRCRHVVDEERHCTGMLRRP